MSLIGSVSADDYILYCLGERAVLNFIELCNSTMNPLIGPSNICAHLLNNGKECPAPINYCESLECTIIEDNSSSNGLNLFGEMNFGEFPGGEVVYTDWITVTNNFVDGENNSFAMYISGTDFYDSSSSGAKCPATNQLALSNLAYFASKGDYSTLNDPRADGEGYVSINYGIEFNDPFIFYDGYELIQVPRLELPSGGILFYPENTLNVGENISLKFRLNAPLPCNGEFDTGKVFIWGAINENNQMSRDLDIHYKASSEIYIENILNFYLVIDGEEIFIDELPDADNTTDDNLEVTSMFEGDRIIFDVQIYTPNSAEKIDNVYITSGVSIGAGKDREIECELIEISDDELHANYHCDLTVPSADSLWAQYHMGIEAEMLSGMKDYVWLGAYSFNVAACYNNHNCNDGNANTLDLCVNPWTRNAYCSNMPRIITPVTRKNNLQVSF